MQTFNSSGYLRKTRMTSSHLLSLPCWTTWPSVTFTFRIFSARAATPRLTEECSMVKRVLSNVLVSFSLFSLRRSPGIEIALTLNTVELLSTACSYDYSSEKTADIKWLTDQIRALCSIGTNENVVHVLTYNSLRKHQRLL